MLMVLGRVGGGAGGARAQQALGRRGVPEPWAGAAAPGTGACKRPVEQAAASQHAILRWQCLSTQYTRQCDSYSGSGLACTPIASAPRGVCGRDCCICLIHAWSSSSVSREAQQSLNAEDLNTALDCPLLQGAQKEILHAGQQLLRSQPATPMRQFQSQRPMQRAGETCPSDTGCPHRVCRTRDVASGCAHRIK